VQDELPAADNTESPYTKGCQDPFDGQDPYNGAIKLLATVCGSGPDSSGKEDTNIISALRPATAAVICQKSDGYSRWKPFDDTLRPEWEPGFRIW
jgi:hypothetical protein